jgi:hypothetical protein
VCGSDIHGIGDWVGSADSFDVVNETGLSSPDGT